MKIYVAGPMTGVLSLNFPAFAQATAWLRAAGHEVTSPAEIDRELGYDPKKPETIAALHYPSIMRNDLRIVLSCDAVVLLNGWEKSPGATLERIVAESTGRKVLVICNETGKLLPAARWDHPAIYEQGRLK